MVTARCAEYVVQALFKENPARRARKTRIETHARHARRRQTVGNAQKITFFVKSLWYFEPRFERYGQTDPTDRLLSGTSINLYTYMYVSLSIYTYVYVYVYIYTNLYFFGSRHRRPSKTVLYA